MAAIIMALEKYLRAKMHTSVDRQEFIQQNQQANEKVEDYYKALGALDQDSRYEHRCTEAAAHREEQLVGQLVSGLWDKAMRQEALKTPVAGLMLEGVLWTCHN